MLQTNEYAAPQSERHLFKLSLASAEVVECLDGRDGDSKSEQIHRESALLCLTVYEAALET